MELNLLNRDKKKWLNISFFKKLIFSSFSFMNCPIEHSWSLFLQNLSFFEKENLQNSMNSYRSNSQYAYHIVRVLRKGVKHFFETSKTRSPGRIFAEKNFNLLLDIKFWLNTSWFFEPYIWKTSNFGEFSSTMSGLSWIVHWYCPLTLGQPFGLPRFLLFLVISSKFKEHFLIEKKKHKPRLSYAGHGIMWVLRKGR
jgi:hypothetical protein